MKRTGPDSVRSWTIVFYCSLISMLLYGVVRLSGIMFVASMDLFQVDRQSASLPYILCDFLQAMTGPVTGFLSLKFGARQVMSLGSFIAAIGIGVCFFAQNIETVTVLWGVVYGFGFGLSSLLLPAIITQHFVKRRATAISLVYVGSYVGFSILPSIADLLIHTYGLSGTYLFLSGFLLHCVPLSMLLRPPDKAISHQNTEIIRSRGDSICIVGGYPLCAVKDFRYSLCEETIHESPSENVEFQNDLTERENDLPIPDSDAQRQAAQNEPFATSQSHLGQYNEGFSVEDEHNQTKQESPFTRSQSHFGQDNEGFCIEDEQHQKKQEKPSTRSQSHLGQDNEGFSVENLRRPDHKNQFSTEDFKSVHKFKEIAYQTDCTKTTPKLLNFKRIESLSNISLNTEPKKYVVQNTEKHLEDFIPGLVNPVPTSGALVDESYLKYPVLTEDKLAVTQDHLQMSKTCNMSKQELTISEGLKIFCEPIFLLVLLGSAVYFSSFITFITVVVDFSMDIGISESDGKYVIMFFSIASNIGLLSFGWVTDCGYLSLTNFAALMLFLRTVTLCAIPFSSGFGMLISVVIFQGFMEASLANLFPLMVTEYYIDEIHELAISCTLFLCGPIYLVTPLLIGFFRDGLGSYLYLFLLMAILSFICSILHFIAPALAKCRCGRDDWILRKNES